MKGLALAVLLVSYVVCQASAVDVAELAKAGVEATRRATLAAIDTAQSAVHNTGRNIDQTVANSNDVIHNAVLVCRAGVDGTVVCCCSAANRFNEFFDDGVRRCRVTVALCTHAACTAIDGVLDGPAAAVAQQAVQASGVVANTALDLTVARQETVMDLGILGLDLAHKGAHLALKGVDGAANIGQLAVLSGIGVGEVATNVGCYVGRKLVDTVADGQISLINALDNALGGRPQRPVEGGHAHQE